MDNCSKLSRSRWIPDPSKCRVLAARHAEAHARANPYTPPTSEAHARGKGADLTEADSASQTLLMT
eukprot:8818857-Alexandrium_andersonii.AAC.1